MTGTAGGDGGDRWGGGGGGKGGTEGYGDRWGGGRWGEVRGTGEGDTALTLPLPTAHTHTQVLDCKAKLSKYINHKYNT